MEKDFITLFEKAIIYGTIEQPKNAAHKEALTARYNFNFNVWLQDKKGWEYGNRKQYEQLLTKENFLEFIRLEKEDEQIRKEEFATEQQSWQADGESENIYYIKDGKQVLSTWDFLNQTGLVEGIKNKYGGIINPVHSFDLLKPFRLSLYESKKEKFIGERNLNKLETNQFDLSCFYLAWLSNELKVIEQWLSDKYPNGETKGKVSTSTQIELTKYHRFVLTEIEAAEKQINLLDATIEKITETKIETIVAKPILNSESVQIVFETIKHFFSTEQQSELKQILETGNNANNKLRFKGNGNRLTDTFKKLIEHDFIIGCQKQDLIEWIISNFTFTQQNIEKVFVYDTVEKTISRNHYPCKSPLIEIVNGQIKKVEQPRTKKYNKH